VTQCVADTSKNNQPAAGEKCKNCLNGSPVPRIPESQCCQAISSAHVVCCNAEKLACLGTHYATQPSYIQACTLAHERAHFSHVDCPTGANECLTSRPPFKSGQDPGSGECDASRVEMACLNGHDCRGDATCEARVAQEIAFVRNYGNSNMPGCFK